jgi:hypothetical protein
MYIYRNLNSFGKIDYIGFCHYRSFFAYLPEHNSPQLNTTDVKYLDKILTPVEQMQIIKSNNIDGILNFAYPETITFEKPDNLINWFKKLNSMLNYLNIPEPLIDYCDIIIKKYIPEDLKPHFIEAQKNLNIYHANIFTVRIEIFKEMMSIFEQAFCDIKKYYE